MTDLAALYRHRFSPEELAPKRLIWEVLCRDYFQKYVARDAVVLDIACGYGEFINSIHCGKKYAIDLNPDSPSFLSPDVEFFAVPANALAPMADNSVDVAFTSNFLEHLPSKDVMSEVFAEIRRVLRPGGRFIILGPNIKYLYAEYWDFFDHHLPLSHLTITEALQMHNYQLDSVVDRFLPYTTQSRLPQHPLLVSLYLKLPFAWRILGKQFLVVARKPV